MQILIASLASILSDLGAIVNPHRRQNTVRLTHKTAKGLDKSHNLV